MENLGVPAFHEYKTFMVQEPSGGLCGFYIYYNYCIE